MKNTIYSALLVTTAMMITPSLSAADSPFNYSYIEGAFVNNNLNADGVMITDRDGVGNMDDDNFVTVFSHTGNGGAGRLSVNLGGEKLGFHFVTDYMRSTHKPGVSIINAVGLTAGGFVDASQTEFRAALGLHTLVGDKVSIFAEAGFVKNQITLATATLVVNGAGTISADFGAGSGSKTAFDGKLGIRAMLGSKLELTGYARYHGNGDIVSGSDGALDFSSKISAGGGAYYHFSKRFALGADYEVATPGRLRLVVRLSF